MRDAVGKAEPYRTSGGKAASPSCVEPMTHPLTQVVLTGVAVYD